MPGLPVFSVEWTCGVEGVSLERFLDFSMLRLRELAPEWDTTFLDAAVLATYGSSDDLKTHAQLMQVLAEPNIYFKTDFFPLFSGNLRCLYLLGIERCCI